MENNELNPQENIQEAAQEAVQQSAAAEAAPVETSAEATPVETTPAEAPAEVTPVEAAADTQVDLKGAREDAINKHAPMTAEEEAELEKAMAGVEDLDAMVKGSVSAPVTLEVNAKIKALVIKVASDYVFVKYGTAEGQIPLKIFKNSPMENSEIDVVVTKESNADGLFEATLPGASVQNPDWASLEKGMKLEVTVTASNTGGLECKVKSLRGFIPMSQICSGPVENIEQYVGQKIECIIIEVDPKLRKLILSRRKVLDKERDAKRKELLASLAVGQVHTGVVRKIMDFGVFVDIGGVDGLLHISQLSWDRIKHPSDVLKEGDEITVRIEKIDEKTKKISFAYRDMQVNPWSTVEEKYPVDSTVTGKVTRISEFGAFVELEPMIEGLVHISALTNHRVGKVTDVVNVGDVVTAKVLSIDAKKHKISLSMKALIEAPPVPEKSEEEKAKDQKKAEAREFKPIKRPKANGGQLRGGRDSGGQGGLFG
ncbi:MAG: S1 RNA-binding domain-containing protein [Thermoguttaceae bacterium]|nr:S1 RNA-binding domain-containing protein [Thermoguttaceae bacterium]